MPGENRHKKIEAAVFLCYDYFIKGETTDQERPAVLRRT